MKNTKKSILLTLCAALAIGSWQASAQHEGEHHDLVPPNGGRIVKTVEPHLEIFVADDGAVKVTFLDDSGHALAPADQQVSLIGGDRMNPVRLSFLREGEALVSDKKLPMGQSIPIVVQIKESADGEVVRERFNLNMGSCPTCEYKEYACACHGGEEGDH